MDICVPVFSGLLLYYFVKDWLMIFSLFDPTELNTTVTLEPVMVTDHRTPGIRKSKWHLGETCSVLYCLKITVPRLQGTADDSDTFDMQLAWYVTCLIYNLCDDVLRVWWCLTCLICDLFDRWLVMCHFRMSRVFSVSSLSFNLI